MTDRAIARLGALFVIAFACLAVRQLWIVFVDGPALATDGHNPRRLQIAADRGKILATDGTPLAFSRNGRRYYPLGPDAAHAVGYASTRYGTAGLEDAYDGILTPRSRGANVVQQFIDLVRGAHAAPRGGDVVTTIDVDIQRELASDLSAHARGAGVVLDPRTGAVIAMASVPSFDPNDLERSMPSLLGDPASPLLDRSTNGLYPPGSTFKIVTASDALDAGTATPTTTYVDSGGLRVGAFTVHDDEDEAIGTQTLAGAFALSSNIDFAQVALTLGVERWFAYAQRWRLGEPVDFDLPVARDRLPARAEVSPSILAQLGFGQASLLVTPLRMALIAATIADRGTTPRPYIVRRLSGADTSLATRPERLAQPVSTETADEVRDMMVRVVAAGTGTAAALPGVTVAGKTGTATNPHGRSHAWFVAFAPADAPRVAVAIVIENVGYGGTYAAPIARRVLRVALEKERS